LLLFIASSSDFDEGTQVVSFPPWNKKVTAYIRINDDDIVENTEEFKVLLMSNSAYYSDVKFSRPSRATVYIKDGKYCVLN